MCQLERKGAGQGESEATHGEAVVVLLLLGLADVVVDVLEEVVDLLVLGAVEAVGLFLAAAELAELLVGLDALAQEERVVRGGGRQGGEVAEGRTEGGTGTGRDGCSAGLEGREVRDLSLEGRRAWRSRERVGAALAHVLERVAGGGGVCHGGDGGAGGGESGARRAGAEQPSELKLRPTRPHEGKRSKMSDLTRLARCNCSDHKCMAR